MAKTFDFNRLRQPVLPLTMADKEQTKFELILPELEVVEELEDMLPELKELGDNDPEALRAIYALAAKLISCNRQDVTVTAEELRNRYGIRPRFLPAFFNAYLEFTGEAEKN